MPPEKESIYNVGPEGQQTDIYVFGSALCEMLTGKHVFEAGTVEESDPGVNGYCKQLKYFCQEYPAYGTERHMLSICYWKQNRV